MKVAIKLVGILVCAAIFAGGFYGLAKLGKNVSYTLWYRDLVEQTVREMVRESSLK